MDLFARAIILDEKEAKTGNLVLSGLSSGVIPEEILSLIHLNTLTIEDSKCSTIIFPDKLYELTNLKNVHIHSTLISEIPKQLFSVSSITNLCLGGNLIDSISQKYHSSPT